MWSCRAEEVVLIGSSSALLAASCGSVVGCAGKLSAVARSLTGRQKITKKVAGVVDDAGVVDELQDVARYVRGLVSTRKTAVKTLQL